MVTPPLFTPWNPIADADYDALKGMTVLSADGEHVGTIAAIFYPKQPMPAARGGHYVLVTPGVLRHWSWFGHGSEVYVPESAIADVTRDGVWLMYSKDELQAQNWATAPPRLATFTRA
jgi:hypothetical protein